MLSSGLSSALAAASTMMLLRMLSGQTNTGCVETSRFLVCHQFGIDAIWGRALSLACDTDHQGDGRVEKRCLV